MQPFLCIGVTITLANFQSLVTLQQLSDLVINTQIKEVYRFEIYFKMCGVIQSGPGILLICILLIALIISSPRKSYTIQGIMLPRREAGSDNS